MNPSLAVDLNSIPAEVYLHTLTLVLSGTFFVGATPSDIPGPLMVALPPRPFFVASSWTSITHALLLLMA